MACKRYLGVPTRTPNKVVYGELGRFPPFVASYVRCVKYCFRLLQMEHTRLPNQAYRMLISLDENGKNCWVTGIREVLCKTVFYFVWLQQGVGGSNHMFTQKWTADIRDKERYVTYRCFKKLFEAERYLSDIYYILF